MSILKTVKLFLLGFALLVFQHATAEISPKLEEYVKLLEEAINKKDNAKSSIYSYEIANLYWNEKQTEKAKEYFTKCIVYSKKAGDTELMYLCLNKMGAIYSASHDQNRAVDYFLKALQSALELKNDDYIKDELFHIATSYVQLGKDKKAIEPLEQALSIALHQNNLSEQQKCYEMLSDCYKKLGNSNKSKEYHILYSNLIQTKQNEEKKLQQLKELEQKIKHVDGEKKKATDSLLRTKNSLIKTEVSLIETKSSLIETKSSLEEKELSLKEAKEISEKRKMEIDLLNKDKELAEMRIKEQNATLQREAMMRNSIIYGILMAGALVVVLIISYVGKIKANQKIDLQNKNIKSSINYAKKIQEAMLPKAEEQERLLPNSFVLFKPRDSVSGDFYWFTEIKNSNSTDVVVAAVDCTGHGVPGAFMSMIGINSLHAIVNRGVSESNQILEALDQEIKTALNQKMTGNNDGMDLSLCIYRKEKRTLEFSGARNPLVYFQNNELFQIKGDFLSIGGNQNKKGGTFKKHQVVIDKPTMLYLFSDGYKDQFGGKDNAKFMSKKFNQLLHDIHQFPLFKQKEILEKTIEEWKGKHPQTDDILVIGIKLDAA